jgi:hypothetical protein
MKKKYLVFVSVVFLALSLFGQENLVPNGGFEDPSDPVAMISDENPGIPCAWGGFEDADKVPISWKSFGHPLGGSDRDAPDLFDSRQDCENPTTYCGTGFHCNNYFSNQYGAYVSIPENY